MRFVHFKAQYTAAGSLTQGLRRLSNYVAFAYHAPQDPLDPSLDLLRARRPPRKLYARRTGVGADAERRVAPDYRAGRFPRDGAVPPHAPRRRAHAGRRRLRAPD